MIVIDKEMPKRCAECPCFDDNVYGHCRVLDRWLDAMDGVWFAESRPKWCPLKDGEQEAIVSNAWFPKHHGNSLMAICPNCKSKIIYKLEENEGDSNE